MYYQIFRAFAFGGVQHPILGPFLRRAPWLAALVLLGIYWLLPVKPRLTGDGSVSRHMITVFSILPGFFVASLAAVATFNRDGLDEIMPDPAPALSMRTRGKDELVALTFRMFTSHLFAYLTVLSFSAVFLFVAAELTAQSLFYVLGHAFAPKNVVIADAICRSLYVLTVGWLISKIALTTLIGLYFLAERLNRPDA